MGELIDNIYGTQVLNAKGVVSYARVHIQVN
jgi:hypothetical protein